jgi:uncharacterized protein (TIGR00730 family)
MSIHSVTVFCSSSRHVDPAYHQAASDLGRRIAEQHWSLVYGGNDLGLMKALADGAREAGGKLIGITPRLFVDQGVVDQRCDELIVTETMRQRKESLEQRGDAFIALPGGFGTLEELFEIIVGRALGYHDKPIVLLNIRGFYDPLLAMIRHATAEHFIRPAALKTYFVASSVNAAIAHLQHTHGQFPIPSPPADLD